MFYLLSAVLGYLLGSFPTGYVAGRFYGIDIREHGSKNMGATNVVRVLGKKLGYAVFICDALKGLLAVTITVLLAKNGWPPGHTLVVPAVRIHGQIYFQSIFEDPSHGVNAQVIAVAGIIAGLACILGHNFPVWLRFKGGKGVATTVGVLLGLMPAAVGVSAAVWIAAFYLSRYVSLASLLGAAVLPVSVWFLTMRPGQPTDGPPWLFYFSLLAAALIFWRHRTNIQRLLDGTESKFARKSSPAVPPSPPVP